MLGVDINSTAVRLLELSGSGDDCRVETCGVEPLATDAVVDNRIHDADTVADAVACLVARVCPGTRDVAAAVPAAAAITRTLEVDADLGDHDLDAQLRVESGQYIPFPADEVRLDFQVLGPVTDNAERMEVLVVAARAGPVDLLAEVLARGGLRPKVVDVASFARERAFSRMQPALPGAADRDTVAVFDINGAVTSLNVFYRGRAVYGRESLPGDGRPFDADAIVGQMGSELHFFRGSTGFDAVDHVLLTGDSLVIGDLPGQVRDRMGIACSLADPFAAMTLADGVDAETLAREAPAMMVACGLALRGLL